MKKVMSLMMVFSMVFMGFASTLAQSSNLEAQAFASVDNAQELSTFAFEAELSDTELSKVDGEGLMGAAVGAAAGFAAGAAVGAVGAVIDAATGNGDQALKTVMYGVTVGTSSGAAIGLGLPTP